MLLKAVGILAISGATAGLLGIGGALIFNPYLLQLGMDPRVTHAGLCRKCIQHNAAVCPLQHPAHMLLCTAMHSGSPWTSTFVAVKKVLCFMWQAES